MKLLSIEAAVSPPSVALSIDGKISERLCNEPRAQAEHLLILVEQLLNEHKIMLTGLDGIAVGRGPGSFTGLRVAAATAQGLAYSSGLNIASVSTLAALAHEVFDKLLTVKRSNESGTAATDIDGNEGPLLVCLDARKAQVYCALYEVGELGHPRQLSPEMVIDPAEVVAQFKGRAKWGVGNGFLQYPELAGLDLLASAANPSARAVAIRANSGAVKFEAPYLAIPEYVRNNVTHGS